ncbi:putative 2OG-Fe(II) oxygenase [Brevundimonas sp. 2R-24]|uniref:2OG-Fe(II) oxygenase n=1 Tax=Peiella sedimenti TaxID=3061083 RepID=A0ABT8SP10_9CAUL|nr:putative 2OG-Fe(II) oxygenase [Caulobacteraceae bacterium XZ-24]
MSGPHPLTAEASLLLRQGRAREALALLDQRVAEAPDDLDALKGQALCRYQVGDAAGAAQAFAQLVEARPGDASSWASLARVRLDLNDHYGAEQALRRLIELRPGDAAARGQLLNLLMARQAWSDIVALGPSEAPDQQGLYARALAALERNTEAIAAYQAIPRRTAEQEADLAVLCHGERRFAEARRAAQAALDGGLDVAAVWLVKAKSEVPLILPEEARESLRRAAALDFRNSAILMEQVQLDWMASGDPAALEPLERRARETPDDAEAWRGLARARLFALGPAAAYEAAAEAARRHPKDLGLQLDAVTAAAEAGEPRAALAHALTARGLGAADEQVGGAETMALLGVGEAATAEALATRLVRGQPGNQLYLALLASAWRQKGDPRYGRLYDYARVVRPRLIETPEGWSSLDAFLSDLAAELERLIPYRAPPFGQSTRDAVQTVGDLTRRDEPVIRALFVELSRAIETHIAEMRAEAANWPPEMISRLAPHWRFNGAWSVIQRAGGHHADHVHPAGWLSSAFYVRAPEQALGQGHEGWIQFGRPGFPAQPPLPPEHFVRPQPGMLVLFPSYMWHGTEPFTTGEVRHTVAFDVIPSASPA